MVAGNAFKTAHTITVNLSSGIVNFNAPETTTAITPYFLME
jgi:hypothetical protein